MEIETSAPYTYTDSSLNKNAFSLPLVEKYRPKDLKGIISHEDIINTLEKFTSQGTIPHLLFHGPAGTGKTSCVMAIAKTFYAEKDIKHMVLELNASDDRGISTVREDIKEFCSASSLVANKYKFKLIILDEVDMMTSVAQAALRRIIEKYVTNVRFCLICNQVSKLIPAVQSRCLRIKFSPLKQEVCVNKVLEICEKENITIQGNKKRVITQLVDLCKGDMRRILNLLESVSLSNDFIIEEEAMYRLSGKPSEKTLSEIKNICLNNNYGTAVNHIWTIKQNLGFTISDLIDILVKDLLGNSKFMSLNAKNVSDILNVLSECELISKKGGNDKLAISSVVSCIQEVV